MAAGLGFKDFQTGEVLTAADVDGYLMQGIWVFASATARDAAVTSPQEGNFAFLKDTNVTTYYTGSAWANVDTTGMTNPMTTTGDTIYSSSGSTPARLGIGTAGQVLTVNSGATAPEWKTPAAGGGGKVLQVVSATYSTETTSTSITMADTGLTANITPSANTSKILVLTTQFFFASRTGTFAGAGTRLMRDTTAIFSDYESNVFAFATGSSDNKEQYGTVSMSYLDSPSTTSSITYKTQFRTIIATGSGTAKVQLQSQPSSIILMEIGA